MPKVGIAWGKHHLQGQYKGTFSNQDRHINLADGRRVDYEPRGNYVPSYVSERDVDKFLLWKALGFPSDMLEQGDINMRVTLKQMQKAERR